MSTSPYWRKIRRMTIALSLLWFGVILLTCLYAREWNAFSFLGFPVGFYLAAQGSLIVFLMIVGFHAWYMNRLDRDSSPDRATNDSP